MLFFTRKRGVSFVPEDFGLLMPAAKNPGRGFYHIYTYEIGALEEEIFPYESGEESLALVRINLCRYRQEELGEEALEEIRRIFRVFRDEEIQMIVRFCYDVDGRGLEREPSLFAYVKSHLGAVCRIMKEYRESIYLVQGLLIGSWGEMHGSRFLGKEQLRELYQIFRQGTEGEIPLAVRKPVQLRTIAGNREKMQEKSFLAGVFDDAIFGTETHMGTFAEEYVETSVWEEMWNPPAEIAFLKGISDRVPFGGEALLPMAEMTPQETVEELYRLQVSYLNGIYDDRLLESWKRTKYGQETLYDYIGSHLGYCLRICKANFHRKKNVLEAEICLKNEGFAPMYEAFCGEFRMLTQDGEEVILTVRTEKIESLEAGGSCRLTAEIPWEAESLKEAIPAFRLWRMRDERQIALSDKQPYGQVRLGILRTK